VSFIQWFTNLYIAHPYMATTITVLFISSTVGAMPSPQSATGFYRWFFDFIHTFTGGIFRVLATRQAQAQVLGGNIPVAPVDTTGSILAQPKYDTNPAPKGSDIKWNR
jgi:hypothetical protein